MEDANATAPSTTMQLSDLKVINKVGGAQSETFLACPKKHGKNLNDEMLFAIKAIDKNRLIHDLRYELDWNNNLGSAIGHQFLHNYDFIYMNQKYLFLCSEHCQSGTLADALSLKASQKQYFSEDDAKAIVSEVIIALDYLHKQNKVHGALNPGKVL